MLDRNSFSEILKEVAQIAKTSAKPMTKEEILGYFKDIELTEQQKEMVVNYVMTNPDENIEENNTQEEEDTKTPDADPGESKSLKMYMEDLGGLTKFTDEELDEMCQALLDGDKTMVEQLSKAYLLDVADIASKYISDKILFEDLIQEGNVGLFIRLSELVGMGSDCGYDVFEEALSAANDSIKAYVGTESGENEIENTLLGKATLVGEAKKHLAQINGAEPTLDELSHYTKMSIEELTEIEDMVKRGRK